MKNYVKLECFGYVLPQELSVGLILNGLTKKSITWGRQLVNYMLCSLTKGKGKANGKGKDKQVYIPKPKNPKPYAKEHPAKDNTCHHCKEVGHCKRNCPAYLAELIKKKKKVGTASSSDVFIIELFSFPTKSWVYDTSCGTHICNTKHGLGGVRKLKQVEAIGSFDLVLPNGLVICLDNCHYGPSITRGVVSVYRLVENGFVQFVMVIHTDVCGLLRHVSRQGASYFITFTDDYSRYGYVYLLKHKHEVFETFKVFNNEVENQLGKTIKAIRSYRGGEYISQEFKDYLKANAIVQQLTPPYTPQHNGVSNRRNRTLLDTVRSMMNLITLPLSFWDYALESATCILNMVPTKKVDKTPYELWYGKVPNLSYLKVWGCEALVKRDTPDKLEQRSVKCIFIGYPKETMGYYFYFPPENKIVVARYAEFFEKRLISQEISGRAVDLEEIQEEEDTTPSEITSNIPQEVEGFEPPQEEVIPIRRSERTHRAPNRLCLNVEVEEHSLGDLNEPTSYKAAMLDLESNKWIDAMNAEIQSMMDNMVWVLVDLPPGCKTVGSRWLFKKKTDMDGIVHVYKARLVAKGYTQLYGVDYEETFSPVADIRAIRILISIAAYYDYEIWQMDVKTAFLNGYLDEDIYMVQPEGFVDPNHPRNIQHGQKRCVKNSSIYSLNLEGLKVSWENLHGSEISTPAEYRGISKVYMDIGDQIQTCHACKAKLWTGETNKKQISKKSPFTMCCKKGQVLLPKMEDPPKDLLDLFTASNPTSKYFIHNIRKFNSIFSFTSIGGKVDKTVNNGHGPWIYRMQGENYHLMPSLGPKDNGIPKFSQLYIFDNQNEIQNRFIALSSSSKKPATQVEKQDLLIANKIKKILDDNNPLVKKFRMTGERIKENNVCNVKLRLVEKREKDRREYNLPTANEVAAIIIGDFDDIGRARDIIVEGTSGKPQRISELHPSYLPLQYPLLFPYAEDGYRDKIFLKGKIIKTKNGRWRLSMREWFAYRMQQRDNETSLILMSHRLYQQFIVDAFTMGENDRLSFIRKNQKILRITPINNLNKSLEAGNSVEQKVM
ncbi:retrotransposon protein, putative, ty1-copia subclass [Tanacetum coccineum]